MLRKHLLTTPKGIRAFRENLPPCVGHGPDGFISTETVFLDALAAHELMRRLAALRLAATRIGQEASSKGGRVSVATQQALRAAMAVSADWNE